MVTKRVFHPTKKYLIEEKDYISFGLILKRIRRCVYDDQNRLIEINHFDGKEKWLFGKEYIYNEIGQPFAELHNEPGLEVPTRQFHIFDKKNRVEATYGELASGHQYYHEFEYNTKGEQIIVSRGVLTRATDLQDIYEGHLKKKQKEMALEINSIRRNDIYDKYWSCDLCDGDSNIGCRWFDPTECPKFR